MSDHISYPMFSEFFQVAYVTNDIERATDEFRKHLGIPKFFVFDSDITLDSPRGAEPSSLRLGWAWVGDVLVELIQPKSGSAIYYGDLPTDRFAIEHHHIGQRIKTLEDWGRFHCWVINSAQPIAVQADIPAVKFVYLDTRANLGHYMEYAFFDEHLIEMMANVPRS